MKNIVTVMVVSLLAFNAAAQDYKPFKVNTSLGYARPTGTGSIGGFLFSVEPKYGLSDQLDVGLRMEAALMTSALEVGGKITNTQLKFASSYLLTGTYLVYTESDFRPYAGIGAGLFTTGGLNVSEGEVGAQAARKLGAMARVGFKYSHLNVGVEYNYAPTTQYSVNLQSGIPAAARSQNSYIGVKVGVDIGGGLFD
jgi:hypothetical protein